MDLEIVARKNGEIVQDSTGSVPVRHGTVENRRKNDHSSYFWRLDDLLEVKAIYKGVLTTKPLEKETKWSEIALFSYADFLAKKYYQNDNNIRAATRGKAAKALALPGFW
jgi:hypothetical protein